MFCLCSQAFVTLQTLIPARRTTSIGEESLKSSAVGKEEQEEKSRHSLKFVLVTHEMNERRSDMRSLDSARSIIGLLRYDYEYVRTYCYLLVACLTYDLFAVVISYTRTALGRTHDTS